jgi:hypothetical protein
MNKTPYHKRPNLNNHYKKQGHYNNYKNNISNLGYYENNKKYYYNNFDSYDNYEQYENYPYNDNYNFKKNNYYGNQTYNNMNNSYEPIDDDELFSYVSTQPNKTSRYYYENKEKKEEILKIKINIKGNIKELIIYKDDEDINTIINKFCQENKINSQLKKPLIDKIKNSIETSNNFLNKLVLDKEDIEIINKLGKIYNTNNDNI